jgi:hypothetical protein
MNQEAGIQRKISFAAGLIINGDFNSSFINKKIKPWRIQ